jgi:formylglycine-generating enzyme required for sulfatase activity
VAVDAIRRRPNGREPKLLRELAAEIYARTAPRWADPADLLPVLAPTWRALASSKPGASVAASLKAALVNLIEDEELGRHPSPSVQDSRRVLAYTLADLGDPRPGISSPNPDDFAANRTVLGLYCEVPAGAFVAGSDPDPEQRRLPDELPRRRADIPYTFYISRYPVTRAQYALFLRSMSPASQASLLDHALVRELRAARILRPTHPVTDISWEAAARYCAWQDWVLSETPLVFVLSGKAIVPTPLTECTVGLPNELEWEKAARGVDGRVYAWGDSSALLSIRHHTEPVPVGACVDHSPYGVRDMCGNVWEWCNDAWASDAPDQRVVRGGGIGPDKRMYRAAARCGNVVTATHDDLGFRPVIRRRADRDLARSPT